MGHQMEGRRALLTGTRGVCKGRGPGLTHQPAGAVLRAALPPSPHAH